MDLPVLDPSEQRVLGSLMEKEITVPASYPLTLNSLRLACNQSTSRDPVVDYSENDLVEVTLRLQSRALVRLVRADSGARAVKYKQRLLETLPLPDDQRALLTVLLLRGAQAPGELKTRCERLHAFPDRAAVEATLRAMASASTPLVRELERLPGQQDHRWIHLLGPVELPENRPGAPRSARRDGPPRWRHDEASDTAYLACGADAEASEAPTGVDERLLDLPHGILTVTLDGEGRITGLTVEGAAASLPPEALNSTGA
ncbi:MAG: YceH family protein [Actinomycetales bacterium]|nr:YceH family protein [Actinomycetales bacterium]